MSLENSFENEPQVCSSIGYPFEIVREHICVSELILKVTECLRFISNYIYFFKCTHI